MKWPRPLVKATFIERVNRFVLRVKGSGQLPTLVHLMNSGRLEEVLYPGATVWYHPTKDPSRKTEGQALVGRTRDGFLVGLNAAWTPKIFHEAWQRGLIPEIPKSGQWKFEYVKRRNDMRTRIDIVYQSLRGRFWVEVKSVTRVINGKALFPDAPTVRGTRHVHDLIEIVASGEKAMLAFVVQRSDGKYLCPDVERDDGFGRAFQEAVASGVMVIALACRVTISEIRPYTRLNIIKF